MSALQAGPPIAPPSIIYSALFVDFDNVRINLEKHDAEAARRFSTNPELWLSWLEKQLPTTAYLPALVQRRILTRRCYLNPESFSNFRPDFVRSAFEVIDCPPLTGRGKTSTDIYMVMDILDTLNHATYFHEFIVLSGDADFTPVLLRIRKHGRYGVVLAVGWVSLAYRAACDMVIERDTFVREALGVVYPEEEGGEPIAAQEIDAALNMLLKRMAARLREVAAVPGGVEASELPEVFKEFQEFREGSHWLGFYSLRRLTQAIIAQRDDLVISDEDPWRVVVKLAPAPLPTASPTLQEAAAAPAATVSDIKAQMAQSIREYVSHSDKAVAWATLASLVKQRLGVQLAGSTWLGAGTFKDLLMQLDLGGLQMSTVSPGYVYDPAHHQLPPAASVAPTTAGQGAAPPDHFAQRHPELAELARKVHRLTETPYLMPEHYALLFHELAREINDNGYQMTRTSKTVRDRCVEKGAPVARSHVNFVLIGIGHTGHRFGGPQPEDPVQLGEKLVENTLDLCRTAQLSLNEEEVARIRAWLMGGLAAQPQAAG
ncbi:MAG: NYN domain-containing protein [candidate division KSB1 bacterium]|nr:NYN domain-containing protein [candidate division KSB1 bacterium]MDZ7275551.1 NYN domain-containing protein [candidate division KSB1 bacterium]MDZ7286137.1 NYN domain-containing protein [candidate division KSB1 bacterium]MDZ7296363.1 NYN domain-containing protein [candidate division KSB1 bacterium]MDZ7307139.1 NYN domain-containing protein [candidate division KSB1 bacterium]